MMAAVMGIVSFLVVLHLSAGVALYWASGSGVGLLQNALVRRSIAKGA
jgi:membrane protein insertase Oxa1/YidC/SpoIIIJ